MVRVLGTDAEAPPLIEEAGLSFVSDDGPGYARRRRGRGFAYVDADGRPIRHARTLARIRTLAIPPAWEGVWICPSARGHIQATGRDARGRKQYIYHPEWVAARDANKFSEMIEFAQALPAIRRRAARDIARRGIGRERVLAAVVQLLDRTLVRVGNDRYARTNGTYGLTTLKSRHLRAGRGGLRFEFPGKNGILHQVTVGDRRLATIVKRCQELPGQDLFQYVAEDGTRQRVTSDDVNAYLREITGRDFTAKDFRTWAATVRAACELKRIGAAEAEAGTRRNLAAAIRRVAAALRNTAAVCRKSYIHPAVLECYADGRLLEAFGRGEPHRTARSGLDASERAVLAFLKAGLTPSVRRPRPARRAAPDAGTEAAA